MTHPNQEKIDKIKFWLKEVGIKKAKINQDTLVVDVNGDVDLLDLGLKEFPVQFGFIAGNFSSMHNKLTNLVGSPHTVKGNFVMMANELSSLNGGPKEVGGNYYVNHNHLKFLEGLPSQLGGAINAVGNTSLIIRLKDIENVNLTNQSLLWNLHLSNDHKKKFKKQSIEIEGYEDKVLKTLSIKIEDLKHILKIQDEKEKLNELIKSPENKSKRLKV